MARQVQDIQFEYTPLDLKDAVLYKPPFELIKESLTNKAKTEAVNYGLSNIILPEVLSNIDYLPQDKEEAERILNGYNDRINDITSRLQNNPSDKDALNDLYGLSEEIHTDALTPRGNLNLINTKHEAVINYDIANELYRSEDPVGYEDRRNEYINSLAQAKSEADIGKIKSILITKPNIDFQHFDDSGIQEYWQKYYADQEKTIKYAQAKELALTDANAWYSGMTWQPMGNKGPTFTLSDYLMQEYGQVFDLIVPDGKGDVMANPLLHEKDKYLGYRAVKFYHELIKQNETPNNGSGSGSGSDSGSKSEITTSYAGGGVPTNIQSPNFNTNETVSDVMNGYTNDDIQKAATKTLVQQATTNQDSEYDIQGSGLIKPVQDQVNWFKVQSKGSVSDDDKTDYFFTYGSNTAAFIADENNSISHPKIGDFNDAVGRDVFNLAAMSTKRMSDEDKERLLQNSTASPLNKQFIQNSDLKLVCLMGTKFWIPIPKNYKDMDFELADEFDKVYRKLATKHGVEPYINPEHPYIMYGTSFENELREFFGDKFEIAHESAKFKKSIGYKGIYYCEKFDKDGKKEDSWWETNNSGDMFNDIGGKMMWNVDGNAKRHFVAAANAYRKAIENTISAQNGRQQKALTFTFVEAYPKEEYRNIVKGAIANSMTGVEYKNNWYISTKGTGPSASDRVLSPDEMKSLSIGDFTIQGINTGLGYISFNVKLGNNDAMIYFKSTDFSEEAKLLDILKNNTASKVLYDELQTPSAMYLIRNHLYHPWLAKTDPNSDVDIKKYYYSKEIENQSGVEAPVMYDKNNHKIEGEWLILQNTKGVNDNNDQIRVTFCVKDKDGKMVPWIADRNFDDAKIKEGDKYQLDFIDEKEWARSWDYGTRSLNFSTHSSGVEKNIGALNTMCRSLGFASYTDFNTQRSNKKWYDEYKVRCNSMEKMIIEMIKDRETHTVTDCSAFADRIMNTGSTKNTGAWIGAFDKALEIDPNNPKSVDGMLLVTRRQFDKNDPQLGYDKIMEQIIGYDSWNMVIFDRGKPSDNHMGFVLKTKEMVKGEMVDVLKIAHYSQGGGKIQRGYVIETLTPEGIRKLGGVNNLYIAVKEKNSIL